MRPIRRFGTTSLLSDRLATKNHDRITSSFNRHSLLATVDDDRRKLRSLVYVNNHASLVADKENRRIEDLNGVDNGEKPEIIINTPAFQLVCDRRRTTSSQHQRHSSADDSVVIVSSTDQKTPKSAMKKSPAGVVSGTHRSRWSSFGRRTVSFADDKGLQLAEIKMIDAAIADDPLDYLGSFSSSNRQASGFIADFILPPPYRRLRALQITDSLSPPAASSQIVLESYTSSRWAVTGIVAIRSNAEVIGLKRVFVRFTYDQWTTSTDNEATLAPAEGVAKTDPAIERYSFTLPFPLRPQTGSRLEFKFCVRMPAGVGGVLSSVTYWDDNHGSDYSFTFV